MYKVSLPAINNNLDSPDESSLGVLDDKYKILYVLINAKEQIEELKSILTLSSNKNVNLISELQVELSRQIKIILSEYMFLMPTKNN